MSTSGKPESALARSVEFEGEEMKVALADGRTICVPLAWFPRLLHASTAAREHWEFVGGGTGIHWPDADEDLSVEGLLEGRRPPDSTHRGAA